MTPLKFYKWKRSQGYAHRNALLSTAMNFCHTSEDFRAWISKRVETWNRIDRIKMDNGGKRVGYGVTSEVVK